MVDILLSTLINEIDAPLVFRDMELTNNRPIPLRVQATAYKFELLTTLFELVYFEST